jgi:hypothetical protein
MRMANDRDQAIVRAAVSDAASSLLSFVPSLGTREVFAFGEGVALPTRLRFAQLAENLIPKSESLSRGRSGMTAGIDKEFVASVVERWRVAMTSQKLKGEDSIEGGDGDIEALAADEFSGVPKNLMLERMVLESSLKHAAPAPAAAMSTQFSTAPNEPARLSGPQTQEPQGFSAELQELRRRLRNSSS